MNPMRTEHLASFEYRGVRYVNVDDLLRTITAKRSKAVDHGYVNALSWVCQYLKEVREGPQ